MGLKQPQQLNLWDKKVVAQDFFKGLSPNQIDLINENTGGVASKIATLYNSVYNLWLGNGKHIPENLDDEIHQETLGKIFGNDILAKYSFGDLRNVMVAIIKNFYDDSLVVDTQQAQVLDEEPDGRSVADMYLADDILTDDAQDSLKILLERALEPYSKSLFGGDPDDMFWQSLEAKLVKDFLVKHISNYRMIDKKRKAEIFLKISGLLREIIFQNNKNNKS